METWYLCFLFFCFLNGSFYGSYLLCPTVILKDKVTCQDYKESHPEMKEWAEYNPESLNSELAVVTLRDFGLSSFEGGEYILHVTGMFTDHQW